jgi:Bacteriophage head to tail connecting protein
MSKLRDDPLAIEIIAARDDETQKRRGYWDNIRQDAATLCYPHEDQINTNRQPGRDTSVDCFDPTGIMDSQKMASGLYSTIFPVGQKFLGFECKDAATASKQHVKEWFWQATELFHNEILSSNFALHINEFLRSEVVFGNSCMFVEWSIKRDRKGKGEQKNSYGGLVFKDHAITTYTFKEDSYGYVDTVIYSHKLTARQAVGKFGKENLPEEIVKAAEELKKESKKYGFINIVRPRTELNPLSTATKNMKWESLYVNEDYKMIVKESGYEEMPYIVARWAKSSNEKEGRGPGTDCLAFLRELQHKVDVYKDLSEKIGNPPLLKDQSLESDVDLRPGGQTSVSDMNAVKSLLPQLGNPLQLDKDIQDLRQIIHDAFYVNVFTPITPLTGTHRTAEEMQARQQEGLQGVAGMASRVLSEGIQPLMMRALMLCIRNGRIPYPPMELLKIRRLSATRFDINVDVEQLNIEFLGPMALASRSQQARGFQGFAGVVMQMGQAMPEAMDFLNLDNALPRLAQLTGVNSKDVATQDQRDAKRQARAKQKQAMMAMQAAQAAGDANKGLGKAPEPGSPAEALMGAKQ